MLDAIASHYVAAGGGGGTGYAAEVMADSPWGFWILTETSGTALADSSGNGRTLTTTGSPTLAQTGPSAATPAIAWPGTTAYASTAVTVSTSAATAEAWIRLTAAPDDYVAIIAAADTFGGSTTDKVLSIGPDLILRWHVYTGSTVRIGAPSALALNTWHHVIGSVGAAGAKIRVNGATVVSNAGATTSYSGAMKVWVRGGGNAGGDTSFNYTGDSPINIAAPALYTTQLSDSRTDAHYNAI